MADPVHSPDAADGAETHHVSPPPERPRAPRWVKVSAVIVGVAVLLVVVLNVTGHGGGHGPGRHTGAAPISVAGLPETDDGGAGHQRMRDGIIR